jgi:CBS domain-containing protein
MGMTTPSSRPSSQNVVQHVYRGRGSRSEHELCCTEITPPARVATIADTVPVTQIMTRELTCARRDLTTESLVELMVRNKIGCVPVIEDPGRPIGMVTKLDLVEHLLANDRSEADSPRGRDLAPRTANELMMPLAITLGEHASIAHAAALMAVEDVHHIPIVDDTGRMVGVVSSMDIVRWLATNDGFAVNR